MDNNQLNGEQIEQIKQMAKQRQGLFAMRDAMLTAFHEMYHMLDSGGALKKKSARIDRKDVRLTISPSARNEVLGMHRLLKTGEPRFVAKSKTLGDAVSNKIEAACRAMWDESCHVKRARIHHDLALSAILDGDVNLAVRSLPDVLNMPALPPYQKARVEAIRARTPYLFEALPAMGSYPEYDSYGQRSHLRRTQMMGYQLTEEWGAQGLKDTGIYTLNEWWDLQYRMVWVDGQGTPLVAKKHGLPRFPVITTTTDGSELFDKEELKRNPFLYAKWAGNLYENENLVLTTLFSSILGRGLGPLVAIDPDSVGQDGIQVNFAGAMRYIMGKATLLNDKAYDADLLQAKQLLDDMGSESTIYKQTLGENAASGTPFSLYAMASQSGQLPLTSPKEAVSKAIHDAMMVALTWIKSENVENQYLKASEIPDDLDLEVTLEVKLPQDQFRMAQIAAQLKGLVSNEWIHTNILQIDDSIDMRKQIWTEQFADLRFQQMMQEFIQAQKQAQIAAQTPPAGPPAQPGQPGQEEPMYPGGPEEAIAGGGANPMTQPTQPGMPGAGGGPGGMPPEMMGGPNGFA